MVEIGGPVRAFAWLGAFLLLFAVPAESWAVPVPWVEQDSVAVPLSEAVRRALATHPSMGLAEAEEAGSDADLARARSARLPRLTVELGGTRFQEPMIVAPLHGFDPMRPPGFDKTLFQGRLTLGYTLFDGGARGARIAQARANVGSAVAQGAASQTALIERAVRAYLRVRGGREVVAAHRAQVTSLEAERSRADRMLLAGSVARVAVLRAEASLRRAEAGLASAVASLREANGELARLTGASIAEVGSWRLDDASPAAAATVPDRSALIERAWAASPVVERARQMQRAADAARREAGAAYWPTLSVVGGYNAFASAADPTITEWQAALQVAWPVFTGGARRAAVERARSGRAAAAEAVRLAELDVAAAVDGALTALEEADAQAASLQAAAVQFEEVVQIESLALDAGAGVQADYLRALSDLLESRAALTGARSAVVGAHVALARLTGDLSVEWLERMLEVGQ